MKKTIVLLSAATAFLMAMSPRPGFAGQATTLLVDDPEDCQCAATVTGNYTQTPTTLTCLPGAVPCVSWIYEKLDDAASNTPGNCGLAGEPHCGSATGCSYTAYVLKCQLASCIASCGLAPFKAFNAGRPVGKKMSNPGDKVTIPVIPNDTLCNDKRDHHFEVRDSNHPQEVIGRFTITAHCANCARAGS